MYDFERTDATVGNRPRGTWKPLKEADGSHGATISCPKCGEVATLQGHVIKSTGDVDPSVVCPWNQIQCNGCNWHEYARLIGWSEYWAACSTAQRETKP